MFSWQTQRRAVDTLREAAPRGSAQVHLMTVLLKENEDDIEQLLELSKEHDVGHCITLLSTFGFRRGTAANDALPTSGLGARMLEYWERYDHLRTFRDYLDGIDRFLDDEPLPTCHAGEQSINIDHIGKVGGPEGQVRWLREAGFDTVDCFMIGENNARLSARKAG